MVKGLNDVRALRHIIGDPKYRNDNRIVSDVISRSDEVEDNRLKPVDPETAKKTIKDLKMFGGSKLSPGVSYIPPKEKEEMTRALLNEPKPVEAPKKTASDFIKSLPSNVSARMQESKEEKMIKGFGSQINPFSVTSNKQDMRNVTETYTPKAVPMEYLKTTGDRFPFMNVKTASENKLPLESSKDSLYKAQRKDLAQNIELNRLKNIMKREAPEEQRQLNVGLGKYGMSVPLPTKSDWKGLQNFAGRMSGNLGSLSGGSMLRFSDAGSSQKARYAVMGLQAYIQTLKKRHHMENADTQALLVYVQTNHPSEMKKIEQLQRTIANAQSQASTGSFMGSGQGKAMIQRSAQQPSLQRFTQIGNQGQNYGTFNPEALGRLGVNQNLQAMPQNKMDALLSSEGFGSGSGTEKIAQILGRGPNPKGENPKDKLRRLL